MTDEQKEAGVLNGIGEGDVVSLVEATPKRDDVATV